MNQELFDLTGKVALVTGASKGLGKAIALALASAGADLALHARNVDDLKTVKSLIETQGRRAEIFCTDVLDKICIEDSVAATLETFGQIDILVNNAGVNIRKPVLELSTDEWDLVLNTNLRGYFLVAQVVVPAMLSRGCGKVINVAPFLARWDSPPSWPMRRAKEGWCR